VFIVAIFIIGAVSGNTKTATKGAQFLAYHLIINVTVVAVSMDLSNVSRSMMRPVIESVKPSDMLWLPAPLADRHNHAGVLGGVGF